MTCWCGCQVRMETDTYGLCYPHAHRVLTQEPPTLKPRVGRPNDPMRTAWKRRLKHNNECGLPYCRRPKAPNVDRCAYHVRLVRAYRARTARRKRAAAR